MNRPFDVGVVGAGPAGMATAVRAAEYGLRVVIVDMATQPGGQYWRHPPEGSSTAHEWHGGHHRLYASLRRSFDEAVMGGRIDYVPRTHVWLAQPGRHWTLNLSPATGAESVARKIVEARTLVICTGGYDRQLPIPGWDLPGVMAAGGVQALLKQHGTRAGDRVIVAGTGPFLLPVAVGLAKAGADVVGICEANTLKRWARSPASVAGVPSKGVEAIEYAFALLRHRIPYRQSTAISAIHGTNSVEAVTTTKLSPAGRPIRGTEQSTAVDAVALGWGFTPSVELLVTLGAQMRSDVDQSLVVEVDSRQQSSTRGVFAAGECTGVGGAILAVNEGFLAAAGVAEHLGQVQAPNVEALRTRLVRHRAFARAMHAAHPIPHEWSAWLTPETVICRCEEVKQSELMTAEHLTGQADARTKKLMTRAGMGWCQGRVCGFAMSHMSAGCADGPTMTDLRSVAKRTIAFPVQLGDLADRDDA